jgi:hypothetical protein
MRVLALVLAACTAAPSGKPTPTTLDLNLATSDELAQLSGIDVALADSILDYRRYHGTFTDATALARVPAMAKRYAAVADAISVTACASDADCPGFACADSGVCARTDDGAVAYTTIAPDGWRFTRAGAPWVPLGVNYDHIDDRRSLAAYAQHLDAIDRDFHDMQNMGFDAARLSVNFYEVVAGPDLANEDLLEILDEVVLDARRSRIALDLTGLALIDRARVPDWIPALDDGALRTQERFFWSTIAERYAHDPTIFAFDLQNEPFVSENDSPDVVGPEFGTTGFHFGHAIARQLQPPWQAWVHAKYGSEAALAAAWTTAYPANASETWDHIELPGDAGAALNVARELDGIDFRDELAAGWADDLKGAIRARDAHHLVTVAVAEPFGALYFYVGPTHLAGILDFACVHLYPTDTTIDVEELTLRGSAIAGPVVIEEITPYLPASEADTFLARTTASASGWFAFYDGLTSDQLRAEGTLAAAGQAAWLDRYLVFANQQAPRAGAPRVPGSQRVVSSVKQVRVDAAEQQRVIDAQAAARAAGQYLDVVLAP